MRGKLEHTLIIGENYDALKNLCAVYTDKNGKGLIDVIYIDPPYNTEATKAEGNDYKEDVEAGKFIYRDKFTRDGWLNMMNERLKLAKRLLSDTGVIFISIDDSEQAYLKVLCDEIFGEENFYGILIQLKGNTQNDAKTIQKNHEYILVYSKTRTDLLLTYNSEVRHEVYKDNFYLGRDTGASSGHDKLLERPNLGYTIYYYEGTGNGVTGNHNKLLERPNLGYTIYYYEGTGNGVTGNHNKLLERPNLADKKYPGFKIFSNENQVIHAIAVMDYKTDKITGNSKEEDIYNDVRELLDLGYIKIRPPKRKGDRLGRWTWSIDTFKKFWNNNEVLIKNKKNVIKKEFIDESLIKESDGKKYYLKVNKLPIQSIVKITNSLGTSVLSGNTGLMPGIDFPNPKNPDLIKFLLSSYYKDNITILDFFAGSGTTGQAVMELNEEDGGQRKFILVTNNENGIGENITRERLYRVINGKGSRGEKINWTYTKDKPCLAGNSVRVFNIETDELTLNDLDKAEKLKDKAESEFKKLNKNYDISNDFDIYNELSALNPQKKQGK